MNDEALFGRSSDARGGGCCDGRKLPGCGQAVQHRRERAVEDEGGGDAIMAKRGHESRRLPMAMRHFGIKPLAAPALTMRGRHVGLCPCLVDDDGGLSGGTMERPALKRLLEDIKASKVQIVVVYKVDR